MSNMMTKQEQSPAVRASFDPSFSSALWGGWEDSLFDRLFYGFDQTLATAGWKAPLAVWEDATHFHVEMELPGVTQDAVDVTVVDGQLVIRYERQAPQGRQFVYNERPYGRFERRLALPDSIDVDSIQAKLCDGLLYVMLSKTPEAQPRRIQVKTQ